MSGRGNDDARRLPAAIKGRERALHPTQERLAVKLTQLHFRVRIVKRRQIRETTALLQVVDYITQGHEGFLVQLEYSGRVVAIHLI
jgi:hypothetical protein